MRRLAALIVGSTRRAPLTVSARCSDGSDCTLGPAASHAPPLISAGDLPQSSTSGLGTNEVLPGLRHSSPSHDDGLTCQLSRQRSANVLTRPGRGDDLVARAA